MGQGWGRAGQRKAGGTAASDRMIWASSGASGRWRSQATFGGAGLGEAGPGDIPGGGSWPARPGQQQSVARAGTVP